METTDTPSLRPPLWPIIKRGLVGRCPKCGQSPLFASYLKQVECCAACGEAYGHIRADDGPAWLTILLVGHVFAVFMAFADQSGDEPDMFSILLLVGLFGLLCLVVLPRAKGMFIGMLWRLEDKNTTTAAKPADSSLIE